MWTSAHGLESGIKTRARTSRGLAGLNVSCPTSLLRRGESSLTLCSQRQIRIFATPSPSSRGCAKVAASRDDQPNPTTLAESRWWCQDEARMTTQGLRPLVDSRRYTDAFLTVQKPRLRQQRGPSFTLQQRREAGGDPRSPPSRLPHLRDPVP